MALGWTQPLTEMSTRCIFWGKGGRCERLTTLPPSCAVVMKSRNLNFLKPSGPLQACNGTAVPLPYVRTFKSCRKATCNTNGVYVHQLISSSIPQNEFKLSLTLVAKLFLVSTGKISIQMLHEVQTLIYS
jgi:hypothetical protein